jgi:hypothetical protein
VAGDSLIGPKSIEGNLLCYPGNNKPMKRVCLYMDCPMDRCLKPAEHGVTTMIPPDYPIRPRR